MNERVQFLGGVQIVSERLFDNNACPSRTLVQSGIADSLNSRPECFRRQSKVKHPIAGKVVLLFQRGDLGGQLAILFRTTVAGTAIVNAFVTPLVVRTDDFTGE